MPVLLKPRLFCTFCNRPGHFVYECYAKAHYEGRPFPAPRKPLKPRLPRQSRYSSHNYFCGPAPYLAPGRPLPAFHYPAYPAPYFLAPLPQLSPYGNPRFVNFAKSQPSPAPTPSTVYPSQELNTITLPSPSPSLPLPITPAVQLKAPIATIATQTEPEAIVPTSDFGTSTEPLLAMCSAQTQTEPEAHVQKFDFGTSTEALLTTCSVPTQTKPEAQVRKVHFAKPLITMRPAQTQTSRNYSSIGIQAGDVEPQDSRLELKLQDPRLAFDCQIESGFYNCHPPMAYNQVPANPVFVHPPNGYLAQNSNDRLDLVQNWLMVSDPNTSSSQFEAYSNHWS